MCDRNRRGFLDLLVFLARTICPEVTNTAGTRAKGDGTPEILFPTFPALDRVLDRAWVCENGWPRLMDCCISNIHILEVPESRDSKSSNREVQVRRQTGYRVNGP